MNREDYFKYLTLKDEIYALARARLKAKNIQNIRTEKDKVVISYVPDNIDEINERYKLPEGGLILSSGFTRVFDLTEFLGD